MYNVPLSYPRRLNVNKTSNDNVKEGCEQQKQSIDVFWSKNQKRVFVVAGVVGAVGATVLTVLGVKHYRKATEFERWFTKATLDELKNLRDKIHEKYMKYTTNDEFRDFLWNLLPRLDKRINELAWSGKTPESPSYPREHGYGLYKPD